LASGRDGIRRITISVQAVVRLFLVLMIVPVPATAQAIAPATGDVALSQLDYADIEGWRDADHAGAFAAFQASCRKLLENPPHVRRLGLAVDDLLSVCRAALAQPGALGGAAAQAFFENRFHPVTIEDSAGERQGFFTGYFEPAVAASRVRSDQFPIPLYRRPANLVQTKDRELPPSWNPDFAFAELGPDGLRPYADRAAIEAGHLEGRGLELAFVESWIEAFFIHVQGSARLRFADGSLMRVAFAAKNGHPYQSIARLLIEAGRIEKASMTMPALRQWLVDHPQAGLALMRRNPSFIFFREAEDLRAEDGPVGAAAVPLRPGISLAVDRTWHLFGTPIFIDVPALDPQTWRGRRGLMIAQDTGSAIVGPTRADIFIGTGDAAGAEAGVIKHGGRFVILWPKPAAGR